MQIWVYTHPLCLNTGFLSTSAILKTGKGRTPSTSILDLTNTKLSVTPTLGAAGARRRGTGLSLSHLEHLSSWSSSTCTTSTRSVTWAPSQYPKRRLSVRSRKVSKPRDLYLELSDRSEIWQALRQQCCRCACQISKRYDNLKYWSRGFETLRDRTERRLFGYWDGALSVFRVYNHADEIPLESSSHHYSEIL